MTIRLRALSTALALTSFAAIAHAEPKPVVLLVHHTGSDQANWMTVAGNLANDGYTAISVNLPEGETTEQGRDRILKTAAMHPSERILYVATDGTSQAVTTVAAAAPNKVRAVVTLSSTGTPDSTLAGVPQYFVHLTADKKFNDRFSNETSFNVPMDHATANCEDLTKVIENLSSRKPAQEVAAISAKSPVVASLK